jgi:hypothetical protein
MENIESINETAEKQTEEITTLIFRKKILEKREKYQKTLKALEAKIDQTMGLINQVAGGIMMLDELESELNDAPAEAEIPESESENKEA